MKLGEGENGVSIRAKVLRMFITTGLLGIIVVTSVVTIALHYRDRNAMVEKARGDAVLIRSGLLSTMMSSGGDPLAIRSAVDSYRKEVNFDFRMVRSEYVRRQFGTRAGEMPRDEVEKEILNGTRGEYSSLEGNTFRFVAPFVTDERCGKCHQDLDGNPLPAGKVNGLAEFIFDVSDIRSGSQRIAGGLALSIIFTMLLTGILLYALFRKTVLLPLQGITEAIGRLGSGKDLMLPQVDSSEMAILAKQVEEMSTVLDERAKKNVRELEEERRKMEQIRSFAIKRADHLGITDQSELSSIIDRLSSAVKEIEKSEMLTQVCRFVKLEKKELELENDIHLIRAASLYLTDLIAGTPGNVKKGAIELALEEAITNAMAHGNLEMDSRLKEDDSGGFDEMMVARAEVEPYRSRRVRVSYSYDGAQAFFRISDDGKGFDWRTHLEREVSAELVPHGRGIIIIRTFASSVMYNEKGTEVALTFDL